MKFTMLKALALPVAMLALGSFHVASASPAPLACSPTSTLQDLINLGSTGCTVGDYIFSNFLADFSTGATPVVTAPNAGNPTDADANVFVTLSEPSTDQYSVVVDYSGDGEVTGSTSVGQDGSENLQVQYVITPLATAPIGAAITSITGIGMAGVDQAAVAGGAAASFTKTTCDGQAFEASVTPDSTVLNGVCDSTSTNIADVTMTPTAVNGDPTNTDSNLYCSGGGTNDGPGASVSGTSVVQFACMDTEGNANTVNYTDSFGVYDSLAINGGTSTPDSTGVNAAAGSTENDFSESVPAPSGAPEPGTFFLLGGALVGLGMARRKKLA